MTADDAPAVLYERVGSGVVRRLASPAKDGTILMFHATNIRKENLIQKANIEVGLPSKPRVSQDDIKLQNLEERKRLANNAASKLWGVGFRDEKAEALEVELMHFCLGLWTFNVGESSGEWVEGDAEPSEPLWAVPGLVLVDSTAIHFGAAGANKSTLQRIVAQSLQYGVDTVVPIEEQAYPIWVNAEEPPEEHRRQLGNVNEVLGLPRNSPLYTIDARGMSMADLAPRVQQAIDRTGARHVFFDSLSRLAQGMNLNENATATLLVDSVAGFPASMNWIGHTGQTNQDRLAGSKHFANAARFMVRIQSRVRLGENLSGEIVRGIKATITKGNGMQTGDEMYWSLWYNRTGVAAARQADAGEWPMLRCGATVGNGQCRRQTWDGVERGMVRCSRHRDEGTDA